MDYERLIRTGLLDWWKKPLLQRWFIFMAVLFFVFTLGILLVLISVFGKTPSWLLNMNPIDHPGKFALFFIAIIGLLIIFLIIVMVLMAFAGHEMLMWRRLPAKPINIHEGLMFFLLGIYQLIVVLFLRMDFKWFAVPAVSLILIFFAGVISGGLGLLPFLGILGLLAYLALLVYHWYRLALTNIFWLSEPISMSSALKKSWESTKGRTVELFLGLFVAGLVVDIVVSLINGLAELTPDGIISPVCFAIGMAFSILAGLAIITEVFIQFRPSLVEPAEPNIHNEPRGKLWLYLDEMDEVENEVHNEPEGKSWKVFYTVMFVLGMLALDYWMLAPYLSNAPESLNLTPDPTHSTKLYPVSIPSQKTFSNSIGIGFVEIPSGEFDMGSRPNEEGRYVNEGPVHRVKISNAFYMSKYEITQKQWRDIMGTNPSSFKGDNLPVELVSWNDIQEFIQKLNEKEGTNKYRLPSEAEWEYAARAGTTTRYSFGDNESVLDEYAWYYNNSDGKTHEIGQKKPNPWGLYDMHGNVWEWVEDRYNLDYDGAPTNSSAWEVSDSLWSSLSGARVIRGGGWGHLARNCRSAGRDQNIPGGSDDDLGFRLVMDL